MLLLFIVSVCPSLSVCQSTLLCWLGLCLLIALGDHLPPESEIAWERCFIVNSTFGATQYLVAQQCVGCCTYVHCILLLCRYSLFLMYLFMTRVTAVCGILQQSVAKILGNFMVLANGLPAPCLSAHFVIVSLLIIAVTIG